jgi:hypothetical protein
MITLQEAVFTLNPNIVTIRGDIAYDVNEQEVVYDMAQAEVKFAEMQAEVIAKQEAQIAAKQLAMDKLSALGLTEDEVKALLG